MFEEDVVADGEELVGDVCNCRAKQHRKEDATKVNKTAISEDSAVCMEDAEGDCVRDKQDAKVIEYVPEVTCNLVATVKEVVCKIAAEDDDGIVDEQDAPIGQCTPAEIPIEEARYRFHINNGSY